LTSDHIADADVQFNRICQVAPMCPHGRAHWCHLANMIELVLPSAHPSPQPKWQIDRFSRLCTAHGRKSLYLTMGDLSPKIAPSHGGFGPPFNSWFLEPDQAHNPNCITIVSTIFAQVTAECPYTLQWVPFPPKLPLHIRESGPPFEPTTQTASLSVQPFFHRWPQSAPILYNTMGRPFPPSKLPLSMGRSGPHLIHGSLGPPEPSTQMASWSVQPL